MRVPVAKTAPVPRAPLPLALPQPRISATSLLSATVVLESLSRDTKHVIRLRAFWALNNFKSHDFALGQAFIAIALNRTVMAEYVRPALAAKKAIPLPIVKPLHNALLSGHGFSLRDRSISVRVGAARAANEIFHRTQEGSLVFPGIEHFLKYLTR
jgi:hypothetical protein